MRILKGTWKLITKSHQTHRIIVDGIFVFKKAIILLLWNIIALINFLGLYAMLFMLYIVLTHSSILAWRNPWTEEPAVPQSLGSQRIRRNWSDLAYKTRNVYLIKLPNWYTDLNFPFIFLILLRWISKLRLYIIKPSFSKLCFLIIQFLLIPSLFVTHPETLRQIDKPYWFPPIFCYNISQKVLYILSLRIY